MNITNLNLYNNYNNSFIRPLKKPCVIEFSGVNRLFKKYDIDPDNVRVETTDGKRITDAQKELYIEKVLEAHEHAQKNILSGNITGSAYATNIEIKDGSWVLATNFNNTRNEISNFCGERSAIVGAFNKWLKSLSLFKLNKDEQYNFSHQQNNGFKIKTLAMASAKKIGTDRNAASPCADCLSWLNTERFIADNTKIVTLLKDGSKYTLSIRNVKDYLPHRGEYSSIINNRKSLKDLDFEISPLARESMEKYGISKKDIIRLLQGAKNAYSNNKHAKFTSQNVGASVMDEWGNVTSAKKIEWSKRWFVEPLEYAAAKALESQEPGAKIIACGYYGTGSTRQNGKVQRDGVVSLQTLGRIKTDRGNSDTIVALIRNNKIAVRTIGDYMPQKFGFVQGYMLDKNA